MAGVASTASSTIVALAQNMMQSELKPLQSMQTQKSALETKSKTYRDLGTKLSDLRRVALSFTSNASTNPLRTVKVIGSDDATVGVTVGVGATPGAHSIRVDQVASRHSVASNELSDDETTLSDRGLLSSGELRFSLTVNGEATEVTVSVSEGQTNRDVLRDIAQAVIDLDPSVSASVVQTSPGKSRLLFQAADSGLDARLTAIADTSGTIMHELGLAGIEVGDQPIPATVQSASDAIVQLDGLTVRSASNELVGVVPGVTLTLHAPSTESRSFRVDRDISTIVQNVKDFITKYNSTLSSVRDLTKPSDSTGANRGALTGEVAIQRLRADLRRAVTAPVTGTQDPNLDTLARIGIVADREGQLSVSDQSALEKALADNPEAVESLMGGTDGVAQRLATLLDRYSKTGGVITTQQTSITTRLTTLGTRIRKENESLAKRQSDLVDRLSQIQSAVGALTQQQSALETLFAATDSLLA